MEMVDAACGGKFQQIGFTVPALHRARHCGLYFFAPGHEPAPTRPAPPRHIEHDACADEKDNDIEHL